MPNFEVLYGRNAILESLRANRRRFYRLLVAQNVAASETVKEITAAIEARKIPQVLVERAQLDKLVGSDQGHHQGIALEASEYPYVSWQDSLAAGEQAGQMPLLLMLDCLQDPQNVGTLLRTAEGIGVHGVILPKRRAVDITPAVVNASAGAVEHLRVDIVSNLAQTLEQMKAANLWAVGLEDVPQAAEYAQADLNRPLVLVVGGEGSGISRLLRERCDYLIRLPMRGKVGSLNASVAGSVALYEVDRQRKIGIV
jgi:23S rRNA (guanosine2251-2'-O)-methyltransferase